MSGEEWRLTAVVVSAHDLSRLCQYLEEGRMAATGCSLSSDNATLFLYGPSRNAVELGAGVVRSALDALGLPPARVEIDQWLAGEGRWGDIEAPLERASEDAADGQEDKPAKKQGWFSTILDGLSSGAPF